MHRLFLAVHAGRLSVHRPSLSVPFYPEVVHNAPLFVYRESLAVIGEWLSGGWMGLSVHGERLAVYRE